MSDPVSKQTLYLKLNKGLRHSRQRPLFIEISLDCIQFNSPQMSVSKAPPDLLSYLPVSAR